MGEPRLVATDLDGTLLHSDGTVTPRTREVLRALDGLDVPVVFTTGRPIRWMVDLWAEVGGLGLAICSNGGMVYDVGSRSVRERRPIPREAAVEMVARLRDDVPGTTFGIEHGDGWARERGFPGHPDDRPGVPTGTLEELWRGDVVKVLATHPELEPEEFWRRVEGSVGELVTTTWSSTFALVEISALGVTKATTLARLADELEVPARDVVAFGDMPNDLDLLAWAGVSYAMANAHPSVRERADRLAPHHDDDGVAQVLAEIFALPR